MVVTARTVAESLGVSVSTVSRALTAPGMVSASTRARVEAAAKEMGYRPNRAAQSLITGRTRTLGLVVPDLQNPYFAAVAKGVQAAAWRKGYLVFVVDSDEDTAAETALTDSLVTQVDGLVLCSLRSPSSAIEAIGRQSAIILLNRLIEGVTSISIDNQGAIATAVRHLRALGHRTIAYVGGPRNSWSDAQRREGIERSATEFPEVRLIDLGSFRPDRSGGVAAADLLAASGATAGIGFNDLVAIGLIERLQARGFAVPRDMSIIGIDNADVATLISPALTTVGVPPRRLGTTAVDLLLAEVDGTQSHPATGRALSFPVDLAVRDSTGEASAGRPARR